MNLRAILVLPVLAAAAFAQGTLCAGLTHHGHIPAAAVRRGDLLLAPHQSARVQVRTEDGGKVRVQLRSRDGRVLGEAIAGDSAACLSVPAGDDVVRVEIQNVGNGASSFVLQVF